MYLQSQKSFFYQKWRTRNDGRPDYQEQTSKNQQKASNRPAAMHRNRRHFTFSLTNSLFESTFYFFFFLFFAKSQPRLLTQKNSKMFIGVPLGYGNFDFKFLWHFRPIRSSSCKCFEKKCPKLLRIDFWHLKFAIIENGLGPFSIMVNIKYQKSIWKEINAGIHGNWQKFYF